MLTLWILPRVIESSASGPKADGPLLSATTGRLPFRKRPKLVDLLNLSAFRKRTSKLRYLLSVSSCCANRPNKLDPDSRPSHSLALVRRAAKRVQLGCNVPARTSGVRPAIDILHFGRSQRHGTSKRCNSMHEHGAALALGARRREAYFPSIAMRPTTI